MDYARDLYTGQIVAAEDAAHGRSYACPRPGCGGRVYLPHVVIQRPHFRHLPGEGSSACDQYFPGAGFPGTGTGRSGSTVNVAVEDDPSELGLVLAQFDGRWGLGLRLPEIPRDELGDSPLGVLRSAVVDVYLGSDRLLRVSALDLRPGVGATRVDVVPSLQTFRTEPAGTWPSTVDKTRWLLQSRGIDAKGTLFRLRRGDWTRLLENSGVHHGETLLVLAEARCTPPPAEIVLETYAEVSGGGLKWMIREIRLPEDDPASVTVWLARLGHELVARQWSVELATPARTRGEQGEPVFWVGDSPVFTLEAPRTSAEGLVSLEDGSNSCYANVRTSANRVAQVRISSRHIGPARFVVADEQSVDLAFASRPSRTSILGLLAQTPRLRVWIGAQSIQAWQGSTHNVHVDRRELPEVRLDLGPKSVRARVTVWERGKRRTRAGLDTRDVENAIHAALSAATRIEIEADNLGRVVLIPMLAVRDAPRTSSADGRLVWRDHVVSLRPRPMELTMPIFLDQPHAGLSLISRRAGADLLVRSRLALRRRRP